MYRFSVVAALAAIVWMSCPVRSAPFRRADSNVDGQVDLSDALFTLQFLFLSGSDITCLDAADSNDDGQLGLSDAVFTLNGLFLGGPASPPPGDECGVDPTPDALDCRSYPECDADLPSVVINEFLAINGSDLRDGDREYSDWIELLNVGDVDVDLEGFYLTDDRDNLTRWRLHAGADVVLAPGEFLVVFASGQETLDHVDRDGYLHTTFKLDGDGEYLALVSPDGRTVVSSFGPDVPDQELDISYGLERDTNVLEELVSPRSAARLLVPDTAIPDSWREVRFEADDWTDGRASVGFEIAPRGLFTGKFESDVTDVTDAMSESATSLYVRVPFHVDDPAVIESLVLWMRYDDGFVAYLNGVEVARANAPAALSFESSATAPRSDSDAVTGFEAFDIPEVADRLVEGTNVLAIHALNDAAESERFLITPVLEALRPGTAAVYFTRPTPGAPNGEGLAAIVDDTEFSVDRGFHDEPFDVAITSTTPATTIRYTTDGSTPSASRGTVYTGPVRIPSTTMLRAIAVRDGFLPTDVDTQTYLFLEGPQGVLRQPPDPPGYPSAWAGVPSDFEMDPEIVDHPDYRDTIAADLRAIPSLSIVLSRGDLSALYNNPGGRGLTWERAASIELFSADGAEDLQVDAGIRIVGGAGRNAEHPKHSFRIIFRRRYGPGKLRYPMFAGQPFGDSAAASFDKLVLRGGFNNTFPHWYDEQALRSQYVRDQWARDLQFEMGHMSTRGRYVHLYLNGMYWGLYNVGERPDEDFGASYFGGTEDDWDIIKNGGVVGGNGSAWQRLIALSRAVTTAENWAEVRAMCDIDNLVDHMLENFYFGNQDWDRNNQVAIHGRNGTGKFMFPVWDSEFAISLAPGAQPTAWDPIRTVNRTAVNNDGRPSGVFQALRRYPEFALRIADRVHKHFFDGGVLTPERVRGIWMRRADQIDRAIVGESARWGDYRRDVFSRRDPQNAFPLLTRNEHYLGHQRWILEEYFPSRTETVLTQLRASRYLPAIEPPELSPHGGEVVSGARTILTGTRGITYYTTDGSDPRLEGGDVSPVAMVAGDSSFRALLASGAAARVLVPQDDTLGTDWVEPDFDDTGWILGTTGIGYDRRGDYDDLIGTDIAEMDGVNASVYIRVTFDLDDLAEIVASDVLALRMKYDDGFVAYLNGVPVASANDPAGPTWNSVSTRSHSDSLAVVFEDFDITQHAGLLRVGTNVLAIHGLNRREGDSDMLIVPEIAVSDVTRAEIALDRSTIIKARILDGNEWSPLTEALFEVDSGIRVSELMYHPLTPSPTEVEAGFDDADEFEVAVHGPGR